MEKGEKEALGEGKQQACLCLTSAHARTHTSSFSLYLLPHRCCQAYLNIHSLGVCKHMSSWITVRIFSFFFFIIFNSQHVTYLTQPSTAKTFCCVFAMCNTYAINIKKGGGSSLWIFQANTLLVWPTLSHLLK